MPTTTEIALTGRQVRLKTPLGERKTFLMRAEVTEGLSTLTDIDLQFLSPDMDLDIAELVGKKLTLEIDLADGTIRYWHGFCIECAYEGVYQGLALFRAELRPWFWFLGRRKNCRIFQEKTTIDIIKAVFSDAGFSDFRIAATGTSPTRAYCVQYRESDYDFVNRLMEEDGLYWFSEHNASVEKLVIADGQGAHQPLPGAARIEFEFKEEDYRRRKDHIFDWKSGESVRPGKVTLNDYNFETPTSDLKSVTAIPKGNHSYKDYEIYDYPGQYDNTGDGRRLSRIRQEANAAEAARSAGVCNVRTMAVGGKFTLYDHPRRSQNAEYLVVTARHYLRIDTDYDTENLGTSRLRQLQDSGEIVDTYRCDFTVQPIGVQYRVQPTTPQPIIAGIQTAVVTGPSGEEIYTDRFGRVKVQFHWDREGQKDDKTSCFVRVAMPWTGQSWGMQAIPRIGQEVVVQFEEGNPDKPLITGMLYNTDTMPPYAVPGNMTQTGIKTNSSKGGGGYNELVFEDKKNSEFVRFQSEKDYMSVIKNNATFSVGFEKQEPGDYTEKIYHHMSTEVDQGDHTFTVKTGKQTVSVKQDRIMKVEGNETLDVSKNKTDTITQDYTITVGPNLKISAKSKIELTCGGSKIEMTPGSIKITSPQIEIKAGMALKAEGGMSAELKGGMTLKAEGGMMTEVKGGMMTEVKGGVMTVVKGAIVMIN